MKKDTQHTYPSAVLKEFLSWLEACQNDLKAAQEILKEEEDNWKDFVHDIEFEKDVGERSKICTKLHQSRIRRRKAKYTIQELEKVVAFTRSERYKPFLKAIKVLIVEQEKEEDYLKSEKFYKRRGGGYIGDPGGQQRESPGNKEN